MAPRATKRKFRPLTKIEYIIVFFIALPIIAGLFLWQFFSSESHIPQPADTSSDVIIGLRIEELNNEDVIGSRTNDVNDDLDKISLLPWKKEYMQRLNVPIVSVSLDYIFVSPSFLSTNQICFSSLKIHKNDFNSDEQNLIKEEICARSGVNFYINQSTDFATFLYDKYGGDYVSPYFYPFDSRTINLGLLLDARFLDANNKELSSIVNPQVTTLVVSQRSENVWSLKSTSQINNLELTTRRPIIYWLLSVLMLPVIFIAISSLIFLDDEEGYWEVAVSILGIWSIREVLLPESIKGPTIVSDIILTFYLFLSFVILFIFTRTFINRRKSKPSNR